jgi:hypothetical protein
MKSLISVIALAVVAVSVDSAPFFDTQTGALSKIPAVQTSITNIGYGAADLNVMEDRLTPLTEEAGATAMTAAENAITAAMLKDNFEQEYVTPYSE